MIDEKQNGARTGFSLEMFNPIILSSSNDSNCHK